MNIIFEKLSQLIGVGESWDIGIAGSYMRIANAQWPCTVMLIKQGRIIGQMANMLAGDYVEGVDFDAIRILNGSTSQIIDIQISGGGAGSNRVLGEVSVINGELSRVKANQCFIAESLCAAGAGVYANTQLWNPVGSGKKLILNKLSIYSNNGGAMLGFWLAKHTAAMAGLNGTGFSKNLGGAASVAERRFHQNAAVLGIQIGAAIIGTTGESKEFTFSEPIVIPPGNGIGAGALVVNYNNSSTFQWNEEPI